MPRTYNSNKQLPPLRAVPNPRPDRRIPPTVKLLDLADASTALTDQFGRGYSVIQLRKLIRTEKWQEGWHYIKTSGVYKVYLLAVQEWVVSGGDRY